jgi:hypothetical protein
LQATNANIPVDIESDENFVSIYNFCKPYTMTSPERMYAVYNSVKYVIENNIAGDFVECGVWKGGSSMIIAKTLSLLNEKSRKIYLYDTFEGMSNPSENDMDAKKRDAKKLLMNADKEDARSIWCVSTIEEVQKNLSTTQYPQDNLIFVKGKVEDTIPKNIPSTIALLRLDTDWYESTLHELRHLYPLLQNSGVLIIDDFGHWEGAKKAVLQYFDENGIYNYLSRIDYTGRLMIK